MRAAGGDRGWFVVSSRPMAEEVAARSMAGAGWRVYLPRVKKVLLGVRIGEDGRRRRSRGYGEVVLRPMFRGYLFAADDGLSCGNALRLNGVAGFVGGKGESGYWEPGRLAGEIVEMVREAERGGEFDDIRGGVRRDLKIGTMVRVSELGDVVGRLLTAPDDQGRAHVLLDFMGRQTRARVGVDALMAVVA